MGFKTTDLSDAHPGVVQIAEPLFRDFGRRIAFQGPIATVKTHEDNSLVRAALEEPGKGHVLVVDGGGSLRCALLGDQLAALGHRNGWSGVIVYGCVRDVADLAQIELGVKALAPHPLKSEKRNSGQRDVVLRFAGVTFVPGQFLYADADGILLSTGSLG
ncbi:MAG: ribonuclease E activity regulator RraA [Pirellulales bacterium]|nr:ribonuclease E activity regulator RraA [Pirellulales bacterium]